MKRIATLVVISMLFLIAGCAGSSPRSVAPQPAEASATPSRVTPEEIVLDPRSRLLDAVVRPTGDGFDVAAWWGCVEQGCQGRRAIATSSDGFATAAYEKWNRRSWEKHSPGPPRWTVPAFESLAQETVRSMEDSAEGVQVVIAGGDGATLRPFQRVGRSSDHGETWEVYDVAPIDGEMAYHYGAVGLPDGRLIVLLDHFSDDGHNAPAKRPHGLWISDGLDWATYAPHAATFAPTLTPNPSGWSDLVDLDVADGLISVRTWDSKLYVSTDGAVTFLEMRAR